MTQLIRAQVLHFPQTTRNPEQQFAYYADGAVVIDGPLIVAMGEATPLLAQYGYAEQIDARGKLLVPGLIDSHIHYPQSELIGSYGKALLEWLNSYTFPTELKFTDVQYATRIAELFVQQLVRHGTTTALTYCTVHPQSVDALFQVASRYNMQMIAGKVCMDRHGPAALLDTPQRAADESRTLIEKWHKQGRNLYALTPRFAPTSTAEQLAALGQLAKAFPDTFIQTHLSENLPELDWVGSLFPDAMDYTHVYEQYDLLRERAVFGHGIHLQDREWQALATSGSAVAFCPTSNLFLGSGLFDAAKADKFQVPVNLATDVGGGTGFSMLTTQGEAYKVGALRGDPLPALKGLYWMTQGPAASYRLEHKIGNLNPGTDADFTLFDLHSDALLDYRLQQGSGAAADIWFALTHLADSHTVDSTWVAGKRVYQRDTTLAFN